MKKIFGEFGGAILLYAVIFFGIVAVSSRMAYINDNNNDTSNMIAINK